jgi:hypothetical protein
MGFDTMCSGLLLSCGVLVRLASLRLANLRLRYRREVLALKPLAARGAVREALGVGFAPSLIIEKHPNVLSSNPPELAPYLVLLLARTI